MEDLLGFASFGKRKRSSASRKQHTKAAKIEYVPEPIEVLCGKSMPCLSHDTLGTVLDSTAAEPPALLLLELAEALKSLLSAKQNLHDKRLSPAEYRVARALANPWESLGKWKFVNRSAMKMAELDARLNLTREFIADGHLSFVDLCGAPGGFSEYLAFRANYREVRGHGISLRVPGMSHLNWQLPPAVQDVVSVLYGADGTGDLYKQENIEHFVHSVLETHSSGVNLVVADGGFQDARNHENQVQPSLTARWPHGTVSRSRSCIDWCCARCWSCAACFGAAAISFAKHLNCRRRSRSGSSGSSTTSLTSS
ncbi:hypothetical protein, variant 7 [Aphanomyces invadans]|uniref:Cap-specific mRNA (nucleoside-2'-O-)-methyltransferase 1 n=1 Tax=Aphanomyces invadans TaxID=157072 RepID=A0A024TVX9_9STRA|nr:hypothetical protein, variant 4 [Aphanomyces invadans]XP_008873178.1 hypothetical protein, variant 5 [Aphanomyces invadans]XP_008873179.1 hypothetical protein, variant 6 [Aphanomyces invadans]XP_008873180.1 hypothetical protein, variant 7 [Aphanomyces invadans]ETV98303.1 hypothetical protein, variant 4 [Aphanomyces invadans]ETV98304.1 hypothetical protein, variant 5 [Aphanomyces invadans]ETV98305.1 hypothetical protein, variant 6 [Aphanomyces invadans]ETV98306.1 hypothetical protein, vari|eukprot:XP_008873177.1 hypothetical protein, variant 4 [Aphanomyces invadans]